MRLRVAREDLVLGAELMIDLDIEAGSVGAVCRRRDQVLMRPKFVGEAGSFVGWREWIM